MGANGVSLAAAFAGGIASFASPCVLPLVPAYLSVIGGLQAPALAGSGPERVATPGGDIPAGARRAGSGRGHAGFPGHASLIVNTALFVAGFGAVFMALGLSASALGRLAIHDHGLLTQISGVVVVAMALFLAGTLLWQAPVLLREWHLPRRSGTLAAPLAGAAFGFGWTPCVGPILASVLALAAQQGHTFQAALLLGAYSLGLGVPFLVVSLFFERARAPLAWLRRHATAVTGVSAVALGGLGLLLVLNRLAWVTTLAQRFL